MSSEMTRNSPPKRRDSVDQDQFLTILSREDALARFEAALFPRVTPSEMRPLAAALGCALAADVVAPIDVPPFDRSNVDGFAVRAADLAAAGEATPVRLLLNGEAIAGDTAPTRPVLSGTATPDRHRRPGAARRRCHRHGPAYPARGPARDRDPPGCLAGAIRFLCRVPTLRAARHCCAPAP